MRIFGVILVGLFRKAQIQASYYFDLLKTQLSFAFEAPIGVVRNLLAELLSLFGRTVAELVAGAAKVADKLPFAADKAKLIAAAAGNIEARFNGVADAIRGSSDAVDQMRAEMRRLGAERDRLLEQLDEDTLALVRAEIAPTATGIPPPGPNEVKAPPPPAASTEKAPTAREKAAIERVKDRLRVQLLEATGDVAGGAALQLRQELRNTLVALKGDAEGIRLAEALFPLELAEIQLDAYEQRFNETIERVRAAERRIEVQRDAGLISELQARERIKQLHIETAAELEKLIPKMEELARASADPRNIERLQRIKDAIEELGTVVNETANRIRSEGQEAFTDFLIDVTDRSKTAAEAFRDFALSVVRSIQRIAAERAAAEIFDLIFPKPGQQQGQQGGGKSAATQHFLQTFLSSLAHSGGIVGQLSRGRAVSPLAFVGAPRYHLGGIAGLAPRERPVIVEEGEEILPRSHPRHIANAGGALGNVTVNVHADGAADGDVGDLAEFGRQVGYLVNEQIAEALRPGGLLNPA